VYEDSGGFEELEADAVLRLPFQRVAKPLHVAYAGVEFHLVAFDRQFNRLHRINGGRNGRHDQRTAATDVQELGLAFHLQRTPQGTDDFESDPASAIT